MSVKTAVLAAFLALIGGFAQADTTTPRMGLTQPTTSFGDVWGAKYNNTMSTIDSNAAVQAAYNTFTSTNVFNFSVTLPTISPGSCLTTNSTGTVIGQSCGGGGGASSLQVMTGSTIISTPTANIQFSTNSFRGVLSGAATAQIDLLPTTTYFVQNSSNAQSSVFKVSSATINNLNVATITFTTNGSTQTTALTATSFINNSSAHQTATMNIDSGTVAVLNSSTATVGNQLIVSGAGLTGSSIGFQVLSSTFNITAQGRVGIGTASPNKMLDVRGDISASTATISSVTVNTSFVSNGSAFFQSPIAINVPGFGAVASEIDFKQFGTTQGKVATLWYSGTGFNTPTLIANTSASDSSAFTNLYVDPTFGVTVLGSTNNIRAFSVGNTLGSGYNFTISTTGVTTINSLSSISGGTLTNSCGYIIGTVVASSQAFDQTATNCSGTGYTITPTSATITPKCSTDKIKITVTGSLEAQTSAQANASIFRGSTDLSGGTWFSIMAGQVVGVPATAPASMTYLDSPATTSATTYTARVQGSGSTNAVWNPLSGRAVILLEEIAN